MHQKKEPKYEFPESTAAKSTLHYHRPWVIYTAAVELEQPFSLGKLQDGIYKKTGIRPQMRRLLREMHQFYETYDMAIINRVEPEVDAFTVNQDIDIDKESYQAIIRPPQKGPGRPSKKYVHSENNRNR